MFIDLTTTTAEQHKANVKSLKILFAAYYVANKPPIIPEMARILDISEKKLIGWTKTPAWIEAIRFWLPNCKTPPRLFKTSIELATFKEMQAMRGGFGDVAEIWYDVFTTDADVSSVEDQDACHPKLRGPNDDPDEVFGVEVLKPTYRFRKAITRFFHRAIHTGLTLTFFI